MAKKKRRIHSLKDELLTKAREAALAAVQLFNNPQVKFKSETFIVLMMIAWTYMLHAYYRSKKIEYRYFEQGPNRKKFSRTSRGAYKYWELERCLNTKESPVDLAARNNLLFLIGLRHEIEHQMTLALDSYLSGRYQACCLNFNDTTKRLFGPEYGIEKHLTYSLQFTEMSHEQIAGIPFKQDVPQRLLAYIAEFDNKLSSSEYNDPKFSYRLLFKKKMVNKPGQADAVVEFVDPNSELANQIDKQYWVKKEIERKKYRATNVAKLMQQEGYKRFNVSTHASLWKKLDAKNPGRGFGVDVEGYWYWYDSWIDEVRRHCKEEPSQYGNTT